MSASGRLSASSRSKADPRNSQAFDAPLVARLSLDSGGALCIRFRVSISGTAQWQRSSCEADIETVGELADWRSRLSTQFGKCTRQHPAKLHVFPYLVVLDINSCSTGQKNLSTFSWYPCEAQEHTIPNGTFRGAGNPSRW